MGQWRSKLLIHRWTQTYFNGEKIATPTNGLEGTGYPYEKKETLIP